MDWQTIAAIATAVAAVIALGTAGIALRQANIANDQARTARDQAASAWRGANAAEEQAKEARRAAKAAEDQVTEARRSAAAAEDQAEAARQQVDLLREQLSAERELRDEQDAPLLRLKPDGYSGQMCRIIGIAERTPGEITVQMTALQVRPLLPNDAPPVGLPYDPNVREVVEGSNLIFDADLGAQEGPAVVEVTFVCTEVGSRGRSWTQRKSFTFYEHPSDQFRRGTGRPRS